MSKQLIPFPFPRYLAEFLISQMNSPVQLMDDGSKAKALHINQKNEFGKLIYRCLRKTNRPTFEAEGCKFYIAVSENARVNNKTVLVDGRSTFMELNKKEIEEITSVFKSWFETCLDHFVDGAVFAHKYNGKTKGIIHASITEFMEFYKISYSKTLFDRLVKHYQRYKKSEKPALSRLT
ncbi:hypothetical protein E0K83_03925 [Gramella sp. BOM4]|nr:hypothetical protein [Christiangramia bathymodioli]